MPHQSLALSMAFAVIANAFGRRFAGGLLGQWFGSIGGTQVGRSAQAVIVGMTVTLLQPVWWWGAVVAPAVFVGAMFGFPRCGMVPGGARDVLAISLRHGLLAVLPIAAALLALGWAAPASQGGAWAVAWVLAAGVARGPLYWLATLWQPRIPILGLNRDGLPDPPPLAELYSGAALGLGMALALRF